MVYNDIQPMPKHRGVGPRAVRQPRATLKKMRISEHSYVNCRLTELGFWRSGSITCVGLAWVETTSVFRQADNQYIHKPIAKYAARVSKDLVIDPLNW